MSNDTQGAVITSADAFTRLEEVVQRLKGIELDQASIAVVTRVTGELEGTFLGHVGPIREDSKMEEIGSGVVLVKVWGNSKEELERIRKDLEEAGAEPGEIIEGGGVGDARLGTGLAEAMIFAFLVGFATGVGEEAGKEAGKEARKRLVKSIGSLAKAKSPTNPPIVIRIKKKTIIFAGGVDLTQQRAELETALNLEESR